MGLKKILLREKILIPSLVGWIASEAPSTSHMPLTPVILATSSGEFEKGEKQRPFSEGKSDDKHSF